MPYCRFHSRLGPQMTASLRRSYIADGPAASRAQRTRTRPGGVARLQTALPARPGRTTRDNGRAQALRTAQWESREQSRLPRRRLRDQGIREELRSSGHAPA